MFSSHIVNFSVDILCIDLLHLKAQSNFPSYERSFLQVQL